MIDNSGLDHVSYILIIYSLASLMFLFSNMLIGLWDRLSNPPLRIKNFGPGHSLTNGRDMENGQLRDTEEFELDGLMSEDDDDPARGMLRSGRDGESPIEHGPQGQA